MQSEANYRLNSKFVKSVFMRALFLGIVFLFLIGCNNSIPVSNSLLNNIPQNSSVIIRINDFDLFQNDLKNNYFVKAFQKTKQYSDNAEKINLLSYLKPKSESVLCFVEVGKENFDFFLKTAKSDDLIEIKETIEKTIEQINYEKDTYHKIIIDNQIIYSYTLNEAIYISSSSLLIENLIRVKEPVAVDETLQRLFNSANKNKSATFLLNTKYSNGILNYFINEKNAPKISSFSDWISLDASIIQNELKFTGISLSDKTSTKKFVDLFYKINPVVNLTPKYAPINAKGILSYTFENFDDLNLNQQKYLEAPLKKDTIFNTTQELGIVFLNNKKVVILQTYDSENIIKYISENTNETNTYQGNDIQKLTSDNLLNIFQPLISNFTTKYATVLENAILFSEDLESLQNTISSFKNEATFEKSATYLSAKNSTADESNILLIQTSDGINDFLKNEFKSNIYKNISGLDFANQTLIFQLVADNGFYHTSAILKKLGTKSESNIAAPLFTVRLDNDIATQAQFVKNHLTNKKEIVVQDIDNILYLISTDGKVLWKKQLNGRIKSAISQVDLYKNGRLQLAFITDTQFLILDRNGEIVKPFDLSFKDDVINSLSVFDYDSNRDYRFLITQGSKIHMYNNKGEIVSGFKFTNDGKKIIKAPQHFRINKKDYIVFGEESGTLRVLSRVGSDRIKVKDKISFSTNDIYLYKNKFTITDEKGILNQVDENGIISKNNLNLGKDHGIYATSNTLATMSENTLTIKGKKVDLELGVYTKPIIFYVDNKIYVSVTDIQNQKIYLFDSNAEAIQNFPVYGSSLIDLGDIDNDKKIELVAKDLENSVIVYRIN